MARLGAAARPAREAAAEQERDVGLAQRGGGRLERLLDVCEGSLVVAMPAGYPRRRERVCQHPMSATIATDGRPGGHHDECRIRIAAAGDVHYGEREDDPRARGGARSARCAGRVDLVLLAGDLTTHGEPEQAAIVADAVPRARRARW